MFHFLEKIQVQLHRLCPSSIKKGKILPNMLHFILTSNPGLLVEHLIQKSSAPCQNSKSYMFLKRSTSHHPINCYPQQSPYCFCTPQVMWERAVFAWRPKYNQFCITVLLPRHLSFTSSTQYNCCLKFPPARCHVHVMQHKIVELWEEYNLHKYLWMRFHVNCSI